MSKRFWLQLFADGGAAGGEGGGAEGVTGDPGQSSLEALGVPRDKAERHRARKAKYEAKYGKSTPEEVPAAEKAEPAAEPAKASVSFDDFIADPENNARVQQIVKDRLKAQGKSNDEYMAKLSPALELLANKYGIAPVDGKIDPEALAKAVTDDNSFYEDRAMEMGVDTETAKHIVELEREKARSDARAQAEEAERQKQERDAMLQQHFMNMQRQAADLQRLYPDFNLQQELQNPEFFRRTSPEMGMSVQDAFYSLHHEQVLEQQASAIASRTKQDVANAIRSGKSHPRENGGAMTAAVAQTPNLKTMNREDRLAYIKSKYGR